MTLSNEDDEWDYGDTRNMDWLVAGFKRKRNGNLSNSSSSSGSSVKSAKRMCPTRHVSSDAGEFKVIMEFCEPFHLLKMAKALENEVGKVKYSTLPTLANILAKYLNSKQILVHAINVEQQNKLKRISHVDGKKVKTKGSHFFPLSISATEIKRERTGAGKIHDAKCITRKVHGEKVETMSCYGPLYNPVECQKSHSQFLC